MAGCLSSVRLLATADSEAAPGPIYIVRDRPTDRPRDALLRETPDRGPVVVVDRQTDRHAEEGREGRRSLGGGRAVVMVECFTIRQNIAQLLPNLANDVLIIASMRVFLSCYEIA